MIRLSRRKSGSLRLHIAGALSLLALLAAAGTAPVAQAQWSEPGDVPVTVAVEEFDALADGPVQGRAGWTAAGAEIPPAAGPTGPGNARQVAFPYGSAEKVLCPKEVGGPGSTANAPVGNAGTPAVPDASGVSLVVVTLRVRAENDGAGSYGKYLVTLKDAAGKRAVLVGHDAGAQWFLLSGGIFRFSTDPLVSRSWISLRLALDFATHRASAFAKGDGEWSTLFSDMAFTDAGASGFSALAVSRVGPGHNSPVLVDDIRVATESPVAVQAEFTTHARCPIYAPGEPVSLRLRVHGARERPDTLSWSVADFRGRLLERGSIAVPAGEAPWESVLRPRDHGAGYFEVVARLVGCGGTIRRAGSRPPGLASYGVLPAITALPLAHDDDSRFGVQGTNFVSTGEFMKGDPYDPLYALLGVRWVNLARKWFQLEPDRPGQHKPPLRPEEFTFKPYEATDSLSLLTCVEGLPAWAIAWPAGSEPKGPITHPQAQSYPPKDPAGYSDFLARVAAEQAALRRAHFPRMRQGYYQVHWEPDWHWKGTDEAFVRMYADAYKGIHQGDPQAVVMGAGYGVLSVGVDKLEKLLPMGLGKYLDGIATHAYYLEKPGGPAVPGTAPNPARLLSPEEGGLVQDFRRLRRLMDTYLKPGAKLFQTEWGVNYGGARYSNLSPDLLRRQAALVVRGHLICLGEGADLTFLFYTADYDGEDGFGLCFNLTMPNPSFGATHIAPKPACMAVAAMTRLLEGTTTLGPLDLGAGAHAYAFQRGRQRLVAVWAPGKQPRRVSLRTGSASATLFDLMGNQTRRRTPGGTLSLEVDANPQYVLW